MIEKSDVNRHATTLQLAALVIVSLLLVLTAWGDVAAMFWASAIAIGLLFIWFLADRRFWLAGVSALVFAVTIIATTTSLF